MLTHRFNACKFMGVVLGAGLMLSWSHSTHGQKVGSAECWFHSAGGLVNQSRTQSQRMMLTAPGMGRLSSI